MGKEVKILMVDDRPENLLALEAILECSMYELVKAYSGDEALKQVLKNDFAVILLDIQMPGLDGYETARLIRARKKSRRIPIIFITAFNQADDQVVRGYALGAIDYIFKPINPETLKYKIAGFVSLYRQREQLEEMVREKTKELSLANDNLRKEVEKRKRSEERFYKSFKNSPSMMSIIRLKDYKYMEVNETWLINTGYKRDEVIGRSKKELNICLQDGNGNQEESTFFNKEVSYLTKSGSFRIGLASAQVINIGGDDCILSVINDITEFKKLQNEIYRLDRLNLVGQMAAGIGHEIRNPLTCIRGFLQLLQNKPDAEKYSHYYNLMIEELDRANSIITEFLGFAKNKKVEMKNQDLNLILESLEPLIAADAANTNKYIKMELNEIPKLLLNEKEIRQLILNLTRNGLEAMTSGCLTISTTVEGKEVCLSVKDEGPGIEPAVLEKIGTPFFTTKDQGTGLGLATCYSIAKRHDARIDVQTGLSGTTFNIYFPIRTGDGSLS